MSVALEKIGNARIPVAVIDSVTQVTVDYKLFRGGNQVVTGEIGMGRTHGVLQPYAHEYRTLDAARKIL